MSNPKINTDPVLPILKYGDPILRKKVNNITDFTNICNIVELMFNTMYAEKGIGLAANQVGMNINLMVIDTSPIEEDVETHVFINSNIIETKGSITMEEGCLSVPDIRAEIRRPEKIIMEYNNINNNLKEKQFSGLIARVIQHEFDHLQGKFFIDYLTQSKRSLINKRLVEISANGNPSTGIIL